MAAWDQEGYYLSITQPSHWSADESPVKRPGWLAAAACALLMSSGTAAVQGAKPEKTEIKLARGN